MTQLAQPNHSHQFVERYQGIMAMGFDRQGDRDTLICYLQKFSDDQLMDILVQRFSDEEVASLFDHLTGLLRQHLSEEEYHRLFLKSQMPATDPSD